MNLPGIFRALAAGLLAAADHLDRVHRVAGLRVEDAPDGADLEPYTSPDVEATVLRIQSAALGAAFRVANKSRPYRA